MGAAPSRPAVTVLVTDMDNTLFARYGDVRRRPGYALLRRVTHWPPAMLAGSERLAEADVRPAHVLTDGFAELPGLIEFHRFVPRWPPASPAA
jgi:hypothetical protein